MNGIEIDEVSKTYGDVTALAGLSLTIESGSTFGLLGTNGAGKSTLFKLLVGHVRPDAGALSVAGQDVTTVGPSIRHTVGYLPEDTGFPPALTGREVLEFHARMRDSTIRSARIDEVLSDVGLSSDADRRVGGYSNGMTRRLGLATALLSRPRILLLDEPTAGLDPRGVGAFHRIVRTLEETDALTIVVSSHVLSEIESLCDTVGILHEGRLRIAGPVDALRRQVRDSLRVQVRLSHADAMDDARTVVGRGEGTVRSVSGVQLAIDCPQSAVPQLLDTLTESVDVDGYEVREPGLERVFERALPDPEEVQA